jgi:hypothetical protein
VAPAVDRDDTGVFEGGGDFGFAEEADTAIEVFGAVVAEFLESNFAVEFLIPGDVNLAERSSGMGSEDAIAPGCRGGDNRVLSGGGWGTVVGGVGAIDIHIEGAIGRAVVIVHGGVSAVRVRLT